MKKLLIAGILLLILAVPTLVSAHTITPTAVCANVLTGAAQQENLLFCQSTIEPDGGPVYQQAINAANHHIIVGSPTFAATSVDWSNSQITYVEFSFGGHMECVIVGCATGAIHVYGDNNNRIFG
jgi:hypothetical protein